MKNKKIIKISLLILFAIIIIGAVSVYFIYGSTLIDITDEKSISDHLAADPSRSRYLRLKKTGIISESFIQTPRMEIKTYIISII